MSDERVVRAEAVQIFLEEGGIRIHFGREATPPDSDVDVLETVAKVVLTPQAFRRLGMSLPEALRRLPPDRPPQQATGPQPAVPPPGPPGAGAPAGGAAPPGGKKMPAISFIGSAERPTTTGTTPASAPLSGPKHGPVRAGTQPPRGESPGTPSIQFVGSEPGAATAKPAKPPLEALLDPTSNLPSSRAVAPATGEQANRMLEAVATLGEPYVHERSFRMRSGELLPNRFLLSVLRREQGGTADERMEEAFRNVGLPDAFLQATRPDLPRARCVHFGFEGDGDVPRLKVYLEIGGEEQVQPRTQDDAMPEPVLEHVAYKWKPGSEEGAVVGRYWWYPHMTAAEIQERVAAVYDGDTPESQEIAFGVVELAAGCMPERDVHYLEIEEDGNPRRSYSINFYDADLKVRDLHPLLSRMRRRFEVEPARFQVLYDQVKTRRFGHLAGGVHRNGMDFFNVYYGPQFFGGKGEAPEGPWRGALLRAATSAEG